MVDCSGIAMKLLVCFKLNAHSPDLVTTYKKLVQAGSKVLVFTKPRFIKHFQQVTTVLATLEWMHAGVSVILATVAARKDLDIASLPEALCVGLQQSLARAYINSEDALCVLCIRQVSFKLFPDLGAG